MARREPAAAERGQDDTCVACRRNNQPRHAEHVPEAGRVWLCDNVVDCRHHAQKVGTYCAA